MIVSFIKIIFEVKIYIFTYNFPFKITFIFNQICRNTLNRSSPFFFSANLATVIKFNTLLFFKSDELHFSNFSIFTEFGK